MNSYYYTVKPEVPGFGIIYIEGKVAMEIEVMPNDDLLAEDNYFFCSEKLGNAFLNHKLTGVSLGRASVVVSEQRRLFSPGLILPGYYILNITGALGVDDFALLESTELTVSERALHVLREFNFDNCDVTEFGVG
jgi:hypothetical protein